MTGRYRLPDALGGHPVTVVQNHAEDLSWRDVIVHLGDESFPAAVPASVLVEVVPPLPPEPPIGLYLADGLMPVERVAEGWRCMDSGDLMAWGALAVNFSTFTPLVPAPEPVELPTNFEPVEARAFGLALLTAADAAEAQS